MHEIAPRREELSGIPTFERPPDIHRGEAPVYNSLTLDLNPFDIYTQIFFTQFTTHRLYKNVTTIQIEERLYVVLTILRVAPHIRKSRRLGNTMNGVQVFETTRASRSVSVAVEFSVSMCERKSLTGLPHVLVWQAQAAKCRCARLIVNIVFLFVL